MKTWIFSSLVVVLVFLMGTAYGLRIAKPPTFTDLTNPVQLSRLNEILEQLWNVTNGRFNFAVLTANPSSTDNGDVWIIESGSTHELRWKAGDTVYSVTGS